MFLYYLCLSFIFPRLYRNYFKVSFISLKNKICDLNYKIINKNHNTLIILGGTLGLFVGMSIMTAIEIIIWILNLIFKLLFFQKKNSSKKQNRKYVIDPCKHVGNVKNLEKHQKIGLFRSGDSNM